RRRHRLLGSAPSAPQTPACWACLTNLICGVEREREAARAREIEREDGRREKKENRQGEKAGGGKDAWRPATNKTHPLTYTHTQTKTHSLSSCNVCKRAVGSTCRSQI